MGLRAWPAISQALSPCGPGLSPGFQAEPGWENTSCRRLRTPVHHRRPRVHLCQCKLLFESLRPSTSSPSVSPVLIFFLRHRNTARRPKCTVTHRHWLFHRSFIAIPSLRRRSNLQDGYVLPLSPSSPIALTVPISFTVTEVRPREGASPIVVHDRFAGHHIVSAPPKYHWEKARARRHPSSPTVLPVRHAPPIYRARRLCATVTPIVIDRFASHHFLFAPPPKYCDY